MKRASSLAQIALSEYRANLREGGTDHNSRVLAQLAIRRQTKMLTESEVTALVNQAISSKRRKLGSVVAA